MNLKNKTILIISPQSWGNMFLAKHHYAIELGKYGNEVYFLNPPQKEPIKNGVEIVKSNVVDSLYLIQHSIPFPYQIKFKWIGLFHFFMRFHIKKIEASIEKKIDIVWSFDLGHYYPFKYFSSDSVKIFNPIDEPLNKVAIDCANGCDIIFGVSKEIIQKYAHLSVPRHFIHHGLADEFITDGNIDNVKKNQIRVGLSGNWLRTDLDTDCLVEIIDTNPGIVFELWGTYQAKESNIGGGEEAETQNFIQHIINAKNVILHGAIHPKKLASEFLRMDAFLITYDIQKDQSRGTNYHKVMEFLSTGKVIISNNITTYADLGLLEMTSSRVDNSELPKLFKAVIENLNFYNSDSKMNERRAFALDNTYAKQIERIEQYLEEACI